jgi:hypothetical protein
MTAMRRASIATAAIVLAVCAGARPAMAETSTAEREARRRFEEAEVQYRAGHYAEALVKYQVGYAAVPLPGFLVNIAQCQRRLGDLKTARATYREFVLVAPDSRLVPEVQSLIRELDALIADLASGGSATTAGEVGAGADVHASDPTATPPLSLAAAPPASETVLVATSPSPSISTTPGRRSHTKWWILGGAAVAALAGGIVAGIALSSSDSTTVHAGTLGTLSR